MSLLTWQSEDLVERHAVVERRRDDALGPQALRAQLVQAHARRHAVVAGAHPVVGGGGHDEAHPARAARHGAGEMSAHVRHGSQ